MKHKEYGVAPNGAEVVFYFATHDFPPSFFLKVENYGVAGIMGSRRMRQAPEWEQRSSH
jgi:hypothetical protein